MNKKPEIFTPMFKFWNHKTLREISIESYFTGWIDRHWNIMKELIAQQQCDDTVVQELNKSFAMVFSRLIQEFDDSPHRPEYPEMMWDLIKQKRQVLAQFLVVGEKAIALDNELLYAYAQHKAQFEQLFETLKEKQV